MTVLNILPECHVDTKVAEIISKASEKYNHQHGCGQIANQLKNKLKDHVALGIIDEDKNKGPVAKNLEGFKQLTKIQNIDRNIEFYQFIKLLINKEAKGIIALRNWIEAFKSDRIEMIIAT